MTEAGIGMSIADGTNNDRGPGAAGRRALFEVLPRLLRAHPTPLLDRATLGVLADLAAADHRENAASPDAALLDAVLAALPNGAERFRDRSVPLPLVCRGIIVPVARELGERWVHDDACFTAVTVGAGRLHALLRALSAAAAGGEAPESVARVAVRRILLLPTPGEQHRLGLSMASALFRNAGWIVQTGELAGGGPGADQALEALLDHLPADLVGFSCSCDRHLPALAASVRAVRRLRPHLPVVAGGSLLERRPDLERRLQLDAVLTDAATAPVRAAALLRERRLPGRAEHLMTALGRLQQRDTKVARPKRGGGEPGRRPRHAIPGAEFPDLAPGRRESGLAGTRRPARGRDPQDRAGGG